jgi:DNA-binding GntR family transcriptional regulator
MAVKPLAGTLNEAKSGTSPASGAIPLGEWVYRRVREEIASGRLLPGSSVREAELTRQLGVSRTPIREALRRLVAESVLEKVRDGLVVPSVDLDGLLEAYDLREELEGTAARMAASHRIEADVRRLEHVLAQEAVVGEDPFERARLNQEFHLALYRAAHNRYLLKMLTGLFDVFNQIRLSTLVLPGRMQGLLAQHRQITEAIAAGNAPAWRAGSG